MNTVRNAIWLTMLFAFIFGFGLLWYILPQIASRTYTATNAAAPSVLNDKMYLGYFSMKSLLIQGFYVLASLLVFFTLVSSIFDAQSLQGYLFSAFAGLIATPLLIYIVSLFWNTFTVLGVQFSEINMAFINSFSTIMLINFLAGLLAFIFIRRGVKTSMG